MKIHILPRVQQQLNHNQYILHSLIQGQSNTISVIAKITKSILQMHPHKNPTINHQNKNKAETRAGRSWEKKARIRKRDPITDISEGRLMPFRWMKWVHQER